MAKSGRFAGCSPDPQGIRSRQIRRTVTPARFPESSNKMPKTRQMYLSCQNGAFRQTEKKV